MSRLPAHRAPAHAALRERLFEAARDWFPDYHGPGGWDPTATGSSADLQSNLGLGTEGEDLGRGLLDSYALALHVLWTYQQAWADEAFLPLAQLDASVERLLAQIGYQPGPGTAAIGLQHFRCIEGVSGLLPAGFRVGSGALGDQPDLSFETLHPQRLDPALNQLRAWAGPMQAASQDAPVETAVAASAGGGGDTDVMRTAPVSAALQDRLGAGAAADIAARQAARARVEMRQLSDLTRRLQEKGLEQCDSAREALCQELCDTQQQAGLPVEGTAAAAGALSESQQIALRQLARLGELQPDALAALEQALARCPGESDDDYRRRLDGMTAFIDAFVAGLVQDARDRVVLLRGPRALARLDRAFGGDSAPSALGHAPPGSDSLYLVAVENGRIIPATFDTLQPGDWLIVAEDLERIDDAGGSDRRRHYREAVRVVAINHQRVAGLRPRFTRIRFEPRLRRRYRLDRVVLLGNNALVSEGGSVEEQAVIGADGRTLELARGPLTWLRDAGAAGGRRPQCRVWIDGEEWTYSAHLLSAGANQRVFSVEPRPGGGARLRFGDGHNGAPVPATAGAAGGGPSIRLRYRIGLGVDGNRAALRVDQLRDAHPAVESTMNPLAFDSGSPPEDRQAAKVRAPAALRAMDRAVSLADVRALALSFDGVQRAGVHRSHRTGRGSGLRVTVAAPGAQPVADLDALRRFLQARVAPGIHIAVGNARAVPTRIDILLRTEAGADPIVVINAVRQRLGVVTAINGDAAAGDGLSSAEPLGLLHPDRSTLDRDLRLSQVYAALDAIDGLRSCLVRELYRADAAHGGTAPSLLSERVDAAADELLIWAPPRDGVDGVHLSFEEARDL